MLGTKLLFLSFFVLSGILAYFYVHELTKNRYASLAAGLAYVFLPYHIIDAISEGHQGSFGPAYMLVPLVLLCLERLIRKPSIKYVLINGVLLALLTLIFPQLLPLLVGPFLVLYIILRIWWERQRGVDYLRTVTISSLAAFGLSLLLSAFWWLPLISEIRYSYNTCFSVASAGEYSATFLQAVTLRPSLLSAPSSAYGSAGSLWLEILRFIPFILVLLGMVLNRRNKYVWFFSISILIAVFLAMGPDSPINVFGFAHRYMPLFDRLRTPVRFLLFNSLAYAVLIGFCVHAIVERLRHVHLRKPGVIGMPFLVILLAGVIIVGNTWQETRTAFSTYSLNGDQKDALDWLAEQEGGDYRIADPPFDAYGYDANAGFIIRPTLWTYLHGKENVYGPGLSTAVKYTAGVLESLNTDIERGPFDMSQWLSTFNVKYVILDKTNSLSSNVILDDNLEKVWTSDTIDIYENHSTMPRVFSLTDANRSPIALNDGDTVNLCYAEGTQGAMLSLSDEYHLSERDSVKSSYHLPNPGDYLSLDANVEAISFQQNDAIHFTYYSQHDLPGFYLSLGLLERDGSQYSVMLNAIYGIQAGWNEVSFPISLLGPRNSTDQNGRLDLDQIDRLRVSASREDSSNRTGEFSLYFDQLSVVTQEINTSVEYTKIRPGKYEVHVSSASPTHLVLSESYHPGWIARVNGEKVNSQLTYQCLNSFDLKSGEYDVVLEFKIPPLRIAGNVISGVAALLVCSTSILLRLRRWRQKRMARQESRTAENSRESPT